jgi:hypothetical protein
MAKLRSNIRNAIIWWVMGLATFGGWRYVSQKHEERQKDAQFTEMLEAYWEKHWLEHAWIDFTWKLYGEPIFKNEYGVKEKDLKKIKQSFLIWDLMQKKNGNYWIYQREAGREWVDYSDYIMTYCIENNLNREIGDRYWRLSPYKDIFLDNIQHEYNLTITEKEFDHMPENSYVDLWLISFHDYFYDRYQCKIIYKNGTPILVSKVNSMEEYTASNWKTVAENILSIPWKYKLKARIRQYLETYNGENNDKQMKVIMGRLSSLFMQGVEFHSERYRDNKEFDYSVGYLLHSFCSDIIWEPQDKNHDSTNYNIKTIAEALRDSVLLNCNRFLPNKAWTTREKNLLLGRVFECIVGDKNNVKKLYDPSSFIISHYRELFEGTWIQLPVLWAKKYEKDKNLVYKPIINRATWMHIGSHNWKSINYESGISSKSHTAAATDHWNNKFVSKELWTLYWGLHSEWEIDLVYASLAPWDQDASKSIYFDKLIDRFLAEKEISITPETREEVRQEAWAYLSKPNTYLAKLMIEWWREE